MDPRENAGSEESESVIRLPSVQKPFHVFFSGDDAFIQPPADLPDNASDEDRAEFERATAEYIAKLKSARETGNWDDLRSGNGEPTKFLMRPMPFEGFAAIQGMQTRRENHEDTLLLAFRLCVIGVEGLGKFQVEFEQHERWGKIATTSFLEKAFASAPSLAWRIAFEIGAQAIERAYMSPL